MLDRSQLHELFEKLGVPSDGRTLVQRARKEAPVRNPQSRGGNVITVMASRKMGREIRTESRHFEFATAIDLEFDESVLEFYPQPCELNLELTDHSTGEIHHIRHVPDFLSIGQTLIEFQECKSHAKLERLAQRWPWRYVQAPDGKWHSPLLQQYLAGLGIGYRLVTDTTLVPLRTENLLHLADYMHPGAEECPQIALQKIEEVLKEHGHVYVSELLAAPYNLSVDHINKGIADKLLVTDLNSQKLSQPNRCRLFRDHTLMQFVQSSVDSNKLPSQERFDIELRAGNVLRYQSQRLTISLVGDKDIVCTGEDKKLAV